MVTSNGPRKICSIIIVILVTASGCSGRYSKVMTHYKEARICCQSLRDIPYEDLNSGDSKILDLNEKSPAFQFDTGKSFFKAYSLPPYTSPYMIRVQSYMYGDYFDFAHIFVPRLIFLNEKYEIVRATDPWNFRLKKADHFETWGLRYKIVGDIDVSEENRNEKFFIVITTEELLQGKTLVSALMTVPIPLAGVMLPIPVGEKEVLVPNSPVGRIKIALVASSPRNNGFHSVREKPFIVPAVSMDTKVGELALGQTTLKQALDILPAF